MNNEIICKICDKNEIDDIKELWEELNQMHLEKSIDF